MRENRRRIRTKSRRKTSKMNEIDQCIEAIANVGQIREWSSSIFANVCRRRAGRDSPTGGHVSDRRGRQPSACERLIVFKYVRSGGLSNRFVFGFAELFSNCGV